MNIRERLDKIYEIDRAAEALEIKVHSIKHLESLIIANEDYVLLEQLEAKDSEFKVARKLKQAESDYLNATYTEMIKIFGSDRLDNATGESETFNLMLKNPTKFIGKMARYDFDQYTAGHHFEDDGQVTLYANTMIEKLEDWALIRFDLFEEMQLKIAAIQGSINE